MSVDTPRPMVAVAANRRDGGAPVRSTAFRRIGATLLSCVGMTLGLLGAARATESLDKLTDSFVKIVDRSEFGDKLPGVTKWRRPIKLALVGQPYPDQTAAIAAHVARLSRSSGIAMEIVPPVSRPIAATESGPPLPIDLSNPIAVLQLIYHLPTHGWSGYVISGRDDQVFVWRADLFVLFGDQRTVQRLGQVLRVEPAFQAAIDSGSTPCFAHFHIEHSSHEIKYGFVVLRTDIPDWARRRCVHEELTQVMGLRNDIKGSEITLFDDLPMKRRTDLTKYDWMFLDVLYDARLAPGLLGRDLRRKARELIAERLPALGD